MHELGVPVPTKRSLVIRNIKQVTKEQRERALKETEYSMFSFPADMLILDFLSDSGTSTMTDLQWSSLFHGDEAYGRNKGYYVLLDAIRDVFERGDKPKRVLNLILSGEKNIETLMKELYLTSFEGGFVNGGKFQLIKPNSFLVPQGRCAEHLLFSTIAPILKERSPNTTFYIPNNGHFDTTEANIAANDIVPINIFSVNLFDPFPLEQLDAKNPFKGNMEVKELEEFINQKGSESVPLIYLTITNNTAAGQPVAMKNIEQIHNIAQKYEIPFFLMLVDLQKMRFLLKSMKMLIINIPFLKLFRKCSHMQMALQ